MSETASRESDTCRVDVSDDEEFEACRYLKSAHDDARIGHKFAGYVVSRASLPEVSDEIAERVGRAVCATEWIDWPDGRPEDYEGIGRAAIAALTPRPAR